MRENNKKIVREPKLNRRGILRVVGSAGGLSMGTPLLSNVAIAKESPSVGKVHFTEVKLVHEGIDHDIHTDDVEMPYIVEPEKNRITVASGSLADIRNNSPLLFNNIIHDGSEVRPKPSKVLPVEVSNDTPYTAQRLLNHEYQNPPIKVKSNGQSVSVKFDGRKTEVATGAADTIKLDTIRVEAADGDSLEAEPSLYIANHGEMEIYGRPNQRVYPLDSNIEWVNHRVLHYLTASQTDPNLEVQKTDGFLVVNLKL